MKLAAKVKDLKPKKDANQERLNLVRFKSDPLCEVLGRDFLRDVLTAQPLHYLQDLVVAASRAAGSIELLVLGALRRVAAVRICG